MASSKNKNTMADLTKPWYGVADYIWRGSGRKRARGDEDEHRIQFPSKEIAGKIDGQTVAPVSWEYFDGLRSGIPPALHSIGRTNRKARLAALEREEEGRRQKHTHGEESENWEEKEEKETDEQEHAHRLTMEETHGEQGGAGNQEAGEEHERPMRKRRRIREADSLLLDRGYPDEAVSEWYDSTESSDVDQEATNSQAHLTSREGRQHDSTGGDEINPSRGEEPAGSEVKEERAVRRQQDELVPVPTKTRTKTTKTDDTVTITTVTKTTMRVSRKRFERR